LNFTCSRRGFAATLAATLALPGAARAQTWPQRPLSLIVPYPPGGFTDVTARLVAQQLAAPLGQSVIVENKPGANGTVGVAALARALPDGHTLAMVIAGHAANTALYARLPYDPVHDIAAVSLVGISPLLAAVPASSPFTSLPELVAHARSHPGQLSFGSSGIGSAAHLTTELFKSVAQVDMTHIPYRGAAAALADLMGGQIQLLLDAPPALMQAHQGGKVRVIGAASERRLAPWPDIPTFIEQGLAPVVGSTWAGLVTRGGTPGAIVQRIADEVQRLTRRDEVRQRLQAMGMLVVGSTPREFEDFIAAETAKWQRVIQQAHIALD
jgi:tripartite-type tricarboxylate transporter receptor subunit TctC